MMGTIEGLRAGGWLQGVYGLIDGRKIGLAAGAKIAAMAKFGQLLQQGFIQLRAGIGPSQGGGEGIGIGPHPQGVEADACGGCPPGLGQGVCVARGVAPVRHQQQGGGAGGVGVLAGQQYGLAERRGATHQIEIELAGQCQQGAFVLLLTRLFPGV